MVVGETKLGAAICYPQIIAVITGLGPPPPPVAAIVVVPFPGVIAIPVPAVNPQADRLAGYVTKTFFVPAPKLTRLPALLEDSTVVLANVVPDDVYVPMPTSQLDPDWSAMV